MPEQIRDGTGKGYLAKVDSSNRLFTLSTTTTRQQKSTLDGDSYNINTGVITLTDDVDTPLIYLKNNEVGSRILLIEAIAVGLNHSTGGSATDLCQITVIRNPTAGTIVSGATDVDINSNRNFGSANTLTVDAYKGATGLTMTDGTDHIIFFQGDGGRLFGTIDEAIPPSTSIGVKVQAPSGNTSMEVYVALICHLEEVD